MRLATKTTRGRESIRGRFFRSPRYPGSPPDAPDRAADPRYARRWAKRKAPPSGRERGWFDGARRWSAGEVPEGLEIENSRLRKGLSDLTLDKLILQEAVRGNF